MILTVLGYLANAWVIVTYSVLTLTGRHARAFHAANAIGCVPVIAGEVLVGAYVPLVLTAFFGVMGWVGLLKGTK